MMPPEDRSSVLPPPPAMPCAYPLNEFYALARRKLPPIEQVSGSEVPEPWRTLLVHHNDMTPTLEAFYRSAVCLDVISRRNRGDFYFREVILLTEEGRRPIEFGAIKIDLSLFPCAARPRILEEQQPLGAVLRDYKVPHTSRPKAYLRVQADPFICSALHLKGAQVLYGRRNTLFDPEQRPLAEIVEILPPAHQE